MRLLICCLPAILICACDERANSDDSVLPARASDEAEAPAVDETTATAPADAAPSQSNSAPSSVPRGGHQGHGHGPGSGHGVGMGHRGMPHDFSDAEHWSQVFDDPARDAWQQPAEVVRIMEVTPGMRVADIGAGTGYFMPHLATAVGPDGVVEALDIEETLVAHMQERAATAGLGNVEARVIPTDDPGFEPDSVHRVLIVNTWHHIDAREQYAQRLAAGLAPGGAVYIVDFTLESEMGPPVAHRLPPEAVMAELTAGGLVAEVVEEPLEKQYVVVGRLP